LSRSFLDTTILKSLADARDPANSTCEAFVLGNQPAEVPYYAARELLTGVVRYMCDAHNVLHAASSYGEAMLALLARPPAEGRKREAKLKLLAECLAEIFKGDDAARPNDVKREALQHLAIRAAQLWNRGRRLKRVDHIQSLACFNDGKLSRGPAGELLGPNDSFNCHRSKRCAAAEYLADNEAALSKVIEALHPKNLPEPLRGKKENSQRRKALKELREHGAQRFDKGLCRAIGDAYFALMCPAGAVVVTTNTVDHVILCKAVGKQAVKP